MTPIIRLGLACVLALALAAPGAHAAPDVPPEAVVATLPFLDVGEPNRIYVDLATDGAEPLRLLLSTSSPHSVFTPVAARRAGVSVRALKDAPYRRATRVGRDLQFWVDTSSSDTGSQTGWEEGFLAANFLEPYVTEIDFTLRRVRLLDPARYAVPESTEASEQVVLPIRAGSNAPLTELRLEGQPLPVYLETGLHPPLMLSGKAARKIGIDVDALPPFGTYWSTLGPTEVRLYEAKSVAFGGLEFQNVPVLVAPNGWYNLAGASTDTMVGYDLLSRFLVRIDVPHHRILLRRESEQVTYLGVDYSLVRSSGAFLMPLSLAFRVVGVLPDTPAARLGLRAGDRFQRSPEASTPEKTLVAIRDGRPVTVVREEAGGVLADVELRPAESAAAP